MLDRKTNLILDQVAGFREEISEEEARESVTFLSLVTSDLWQAQILKLRVRRLALMQ